jgi:hypothetical protein
MYAPPADRQAPHFPAVAAATVRLPGADDAAFDEGPGLLASRAFWLGGLFSVMAWSGAVALVLRWF